MWVSRISSPEKRMTSHLPSDSTLSTVRPATGVSSFTRANFTSTVSNRVTTLPPIARWRVRAVRQIVSPSGTLVLVLLILGRPWIHLQHRSYSTHLVPVRRDDKPGLLQEPPEKMLPRDHSIDLRNQEPGPPP